MEQKSNYSELGNLDICYVFSVMFVSLPGALILCVQIGILVENHNMANRSLGLGILKGLSYWKFGDIKIKRGNMEMVIFSRE